MSRLSNKEISYIKKDLQARGIVHSPLQSELIDHICCEVEDLLKNGESFKEVYEQVLRTLPDEQLVTVQDQTIKSENYNTFMLLKNNFKILFRNMLKNGSFTFINIGGLALGLLCFVVIVVYVKHELSYEKNFSKSNSIYRITMSSTVGGSINHIPTSFPTLGPALKDRFNDIESYVRIVNYKYTRLIPTIEYKDKIFYEEKVIFADPTFLTVFDFPLLEGNPASALVNPTSVIITKQVAQKYFGNESALGKHIRFNASTDLEITGVLATLPSNTHLQFDFLIPMTGLQYSGVFRNANILENWQIDWFWTYFVIPEKNSISRVVEGMDRLTSEMIPDVKKENNIKFYLQALHDIHLGSGDFDYNTDLMENGDYSSLYIFGSVGILVLLISGINFINITIAMATRRYKEIGVSKVLGAYRSQLQFQFILEAIITCLLSLLIAFFLLPLGLPLFSSLLAIPLTFNITANVGIIGGMLLFTILIGILSGLYPAFFVSSFEPQRVLKGIFNPGTGGAHFRKVLVGVQIAISVFLIIGTIIIFRQLSYIQNKALGFDKEQIVMLNVRGTSIPKSYYALKQRLENQSSVIQVAGVSEPIGREVQFMTFRIQDIENDQFIKIINVTHDFVQTMGLQLIQGTDFSHTADSSRGFIINEAAARSFGWSDAIGKNIKHAFPNAPEGKVVGVVKDFNFEPLHKRIDPLIIFMGSANWYVAVKIKLGNASQTLSFLEKTWKEFEPIKPFSFHFLDQSIQHVYEKEARTSRVFLVFSILSILTASLGLFGLIAYVTEQRLVEIGVRKVMGASVFNIISIILNEYIVLLLVAFAMAAPLTYYIMNQWLQDFAFRIEWNALYFLCGLVSILIIVASTVVVKTWKAASTNPIRILRSE
jgi:putative ABC transport system permease protein